MHSKANEKYGRNKILCHAVADTKCYELVDAPQTSEHEYTATEHNLIIEIIQKSAKTIYERIMLTFYIQNLPKPFATMRQTALSWRIGELEKEREKASIQREEKTPANPEHSSAQIV